MVKAATTAAFAFHGMRTPQSRRTADSTLKTSSNVLVTVTASQTWYYDGQHYSRATMDEIKECIVDPERTMFVHRLRGVLIHGCGKSQSNARTGIQITAHSTVRPAMAYESVACCVRFVTRATRKHTDNIEKVSVAMYSWLLIQASILCLLIVVDPRVLNRCPRPYRVARMVRVVWATARQVAMVQKMSSHPSGPWIFSRMNMRMLQACSVQTTPVTATMTT